MKPRGHNFSIGRRPVDEGWQLIGTCKCGYRVTATNYDDLRALTHDHYDDMRRKAAEDQHA